MPVWQREAVSFYPSCVFLFCWATIVYCPVVYWIWGGGMGLVLERRSIGLCGWVGPWKSYPVSPRSSTLPFGPASREFDDQLQTTQYLDYILGTLFIVCRLVVFSTDFRVLMHPLKCHIRCSTHIWLVLLVAISWCLLDFRLENKWSMVAVCSGCISGETVAATPSSGMIHSGPLSF